VRFRLVVDKINRLLLTGARYSEVVAKVAKASLTVQGLKEKIAIDSEHK
jgi:hypothetical protein